MRQFSVSETLINLDKDPRLGAKKLLRRAMMEKGFTIIEAQSFYPLVDLEFTPTQITKELDMFGIKTDASKTQARKNVKLIPLLLDMFTKEDIEKAKGSLSLFNFPEICAKLPHGKEQIIY